MERWVTTPFSPMATFAIMLLVAVTTVVVCTWLRKRKPQVWEELTQGMFKSLSLKSDKGRD